MLKKSIKKMYGKKAGAGTVASAASGYIWHMLLPW